MSKALFSTQPLWQNNGLAILRIITGAFMAYHGSEMFDRKAMLPYLEWDVIKSLPVPETMLYFGKGLEFVSGIVLYSVCLQGLLLCLWQLICCSFALKLVMENFGMKISILSFFALLALVFFFTGPVKWSLDKIWFSRK